MSNFSHVPIMVEEVLALLKPERGGIFVDGTLGGGGHAEAILQKLPENSRYYGIDRDENAIRAAGERLSPFGERFQAIRGNFFDMKMLLAEKGVYGVDGILLDLGVSSHQIDTKERGFSYHEDAPLDMRMDQSAALSAYEVVNHYGEAELKRILYEYGEERYSGRIVSAILRQRAIKPIERTGELAEIIRQAMPGAGRKEAQHPARRSFQAIRIEVNGELEGLEKALQDAHDLLNPGGVLAVISFHSLEDRIVKLSFRGFEDPCICDKRAPICTCGRKATVRILTKKPLTATETEISLNSRSHCAKLRGIEKL